MKALILKDLYQLKAYCKSLLLLVCVFTLVVPFSDGNLFFCIYPVMMISMLPMTLLSYDERTKWNCYCAALPFRRSQIVTAKYLLCLLLTLPMALLVLGLSAIRIAVSGSGQWSALAVLAVSLLVMSTLSSSLSMPFLFRFGVEKGRLLYIIIVCIACSSSFVIQDLTTSVVLPVPVLPVMVLLCAGIFVLSWRLSIAMFERMEIR